MAKAPPPPGYSGKPLYEKLGIMPGMKTKIIHPPKEYFTWVDNQVKKQNANPPFDFAHLFTNSLSELEDQLFELKKSLAPDGMIWVSWYKKSAKQPTEITEDLIRDTCLPLGLVDVKVCAVSDDWSGLKLVIRKALR